MYIHLGNNAVVKTDEIIGIFDMDSSTVSAKTREYLRKAEKERNIIFTGSELPKTFIVTAKKKYENKVFLSVLASSTLSRRREYTKNNNYFKEKIK